MKKANLLKTEITEKMMSGINCSQCVLSYWADELGYDEDELFRMATAFGGGMYRGDTCGAVTGGLIALGLNFGGIEPEERALAKEKAKAFQAAFTEKLGSTLCHELLGCAMLTPEDCEKAAASGKILDFCPKCVMTALEILDELM